MQSAKDFNMVSVIYCARIVAFKAVIGASCKNLASIVCRFYIIVTQVCL